MNIAIIAIIGMAVLVTATVGFGASLGSTPTVNLIGASDNVLVNAARGNITAIVWNDLVGADGFVEIDKITFTVGNEHVGTDHAFSVCAVIEGPAATFTPAVGQPPACVAVSSLAALAETTGKEITFPAVTEVSDIVDISFTIEETS